MITSSFPFGHPPTAQPPSPYFLLPPNRQWHNTPSVLRPLCRAGNFALARRHILQLQHDIAHSGIHHIILPLVGSRHQLPLGRRNIRHFQRQNTLRRHTHYKHTRKNGNIISLFYKPNYYINYFIYFFASSFTVGYSNHSQAVVPKTAKSNSCLTNC